MLESSENGLLIHSMEQFGSMGEKIEKEVIKKT
jgi:hypothetical protein